MKYTDTCNIRENLARFAGVGRSSLRQRQMLHSEGGNDPPAGSDDAWPAEFHKIINRVTERLDSRFRFDDNGRIVFTPSRPTGAEGPPQ